jgi:hypothetical protein
LALRYNPILTVFLISLSFVSCESVTEGPFEHKYVINLVLRPNMKIQKAYVDSTYRLDEAIPEGFEGIRDAEILAVDEQEDTFKFNRSDTIGIYYSVDSMWVKYSSKYFIQVNIEGHQIEEEVNIPDSLLIYSPSNGDTISLNSPEIVYWNSCKGSFDNMYTARVFFEGELDSFYTSLLTQDTSLNVFSARYLFPNVDTFYTLAVMAMDENCFKSDVYFDYDQLDEEFAMGVIGTIVLDTIKVWVTE